MLFLRVLSSAILVFVFAVLCVSEFAAAQSRGQNILDNPGFEILPSGVQMQNGNNFTLLGGLNFPIPFWEASIGRPNLVRVDGPGGYDYGNAGPESDADMSGPGRVKHYMDFVGATGSLQQRFTVPLCAGEPAETIRVTFGTSYASRGDPTVGFFGISGIFADGPGPGATLALTSFANLPSGPSRNYPWTQRSETVTLTRGQSYWFVFSMPDEASADNAFVAIAPEDACPAASGEDGTETFLRARNAALLAAQPDRHRRLNKLKRNAADNARQIDLTLDADTLSMATSLQRFAETQTFDHWDIWLEAHLVGFDDSATQGGRLGVAYMGVDVQLNDRVLLGLIGQLDHFDLAFTDDDDISGTGWMVGPYATILFGHNLFLDMRAAWGQSHNQVTINKEKAGEFDTDRWLVSGALVGDINWGALELRPELQFNYLEEHQEAFWSGDVRVAAQTIGQGDVRFGPRLAYRHRLEGGALFSPYARADIVYNFQRGGSGESDTGPALALNNTFHARVEAGFTYESALGLSMTASTYADGIGQDGYQLYGGMVRFNMPLN